MDAPVVAAVHAFMQTALAPESDISRLILYSAGVIVVGVMGWVIRVTRKVDRTVTRLTDYLFGFNGTNGLNSDVKGLRDDVDTILRERRSGHERRQQ